MTRAALKPLVAAGMATCARCLRPIRPGESFDLDHNGARDGYIGVSHASCNRSAGAKVRNRGPSREWVR